MNAQILFVSGFFGGVLRPASAVNVVLSVMAFVTFGAVLFRNKELVQRAVREGDAFSPAAASQLVFIQRTTSVKWFGYTVIWALVALKVINIETERILFTCLDLFKAGLAICGWALSL